jgi:hypothetical protein
VSQLWAIASVSVRVGAILLDDEDRFAQPNNGVQVVKAQLVEPRPLPLDFPIA